MFSLVFGMLSDKSIIPLNGRLSLTLPVRAFPVWTVGSVSRTTMGTLLT